MTALASLLFHRSRIRARPLTGWKNRPQHLGDVCPTLSAGEPSAQEEAGPSQKTLGPRKLEGESKTGGDQRRPAVEGGMVSGR